MPSTKYWKKSFVMRKSWKRIHSGSMSSPKKVTTIKTKKRLAIKQAKPTDDTVRPRRNPMRLNKNMDMYLFADLEKTERRLQYISSQHYIRSEEDDVIENSSNKIAELKQEKQQMKEEIALLKLKIDLLLNMLAVATAITNYQHDELKRLRAQIGKS